MHTDAVARTIEVVPTPNPDARMFKLSELLIPSGTHEFKRGDATADAPLARALLALDGVELVLVAPRFVTIRKNPDEDWAWLEPNVKGALEAFLDSGEMAIYEAPAASKATKRALSELETRILAVLDEEVRPALAQDGGDLDFEGFEDGVVYLKLTGACGTCPSSTATLKSGIEYLLREEFEEVKEVVNVDHP